MMAGCTGIALMYKASYQTVFMTVHRDTFGVEPAETVAGRLCELKNENKMCLMPTVFLSGWKNSFYTIKDDKVVKI